MLACKGKGLHSSMLKRVAKRLTQPILLQKTKVRPLCLFKK